MEAVAAKDTQAIKVSSKRQITIPAKWFKEMEFGEYALCTWTEQGILLQPLQSEDEDITVDILRRLIEQGYEGESLLQKYQEVRPRIAKYAEKLSEGEEDIAKGRVLPLDDVLSRVKDRYDL